jgi:hypothetical protein
MRADGMEIFHFGAAAGTKTRCELADWAPRSVSDENDCARSGRAPKQPAHRRLHHGADTLRGTSWRSAHGRRPFLARARRTR